MMNRVQRLPDWLRFRSRRAAVLTALVTCLLLAPWVAEAQGVNSAPTFGESGLLVYANDTGSTATTYTDSDATTPGEWYTYRVKALRGDQESTHSNYARVDLPQTTPLPREHGDSDSDYEAEINASESLTVGSVRTVSIIPAWDEDWFEIDLDATKSYSIQLTDHSRHDGQVYPRLMGIRDSEGNLILGSTEGTGWYYEGRTTHHILDPMETGKYYIVVGLHQWDQFWGIARTGDYQIEVVEVETDDVAGDLSTTATLTVGQTRSLVAELPGDRDWFRVGLLRDHTYRVEAVGGYSSLYGVRDSEGVRLPDTIEHSVFYSNQPVEWIRQFFTVPEDGDYYIDLGAYPEGTGTFSLTLYDDTEDDFPDDITTTGTAPVDGSVTGNIELPGDRDWFRTTMESGKKYRIDVNPKYPYAPAYQHYLSMVPKLHGIYDVDGDLIDGTSGGGRSGMYFQPPNNGTYYISARSYTHTWESAYDRSTGEYVLVVSEVPVDLPDDVSTTGSVADTRPVSGWVNQAHEKDWYRLDAVMGQSYEIYLASPNGTWVHKICDPYSVDPARLGCWPPIRTWNHGTCDPYLVGVYDPSGNLIPGTRNDNIYGHQYWFFRHDALNARSHFTAEEDGAYHVSVSGHCLGTYFLMAYEEKDDLPADTTTTGVVKVGGALSGRIEVIDDDAWHQHGDYWHQDWDQDWIRVALTEGQSYRVRLRARWGDRPPHGTISNLYLGGIHDSDGNYIDGTALGDTSDDFSGVHQPQINFTAPETGDFYIEVGGRPYDYGTYVLDVTVVNQAVQPQQSNTPATGAPTISGTAQVGGMLTAITSAIDDADGMVNASFTYQWQRQDLGTSAETDILGATDATYEVTSDDRDSAVRVSVSFSDDAENSETLTSYWLLTQAPANNLATGVPTISGTAQVGGMLTADTSSIADADGLTNVSYEYQWIASKGSSDVEIANATAPTYTVADDDAGWTIQVRVTFTDDADNEQTLTSEATEAVEFAIQPQRANTPATGAPTISGTAQVGGMLTAITSAIDDADGLVNASFTYQWERQDLTTSAETDIPGATGTTYEVTSDDRDGAVRVSVSFSDDAENSETLTSYWLLTMTPPNHPPTGAPTISGTAQVGGMLTADTSRIADADGLTNVNYGYQWISSDGTTDTDISGETDAAYTLVADDVGRTIKVRVTFTDDAENETTLTSTATDEVDFAVQQQTANNPATGSPTISGTAQVGEMLTADTSGIADDDGLDNATFRYRWLADDADITGATASTYSLVAADEGKTIKVRVIVTDDAENETTLTSTATAVVAAPEPPAMPTGLSPSVSHDDVTLTWDDPQDDSITGYVILRRDRAIHLVGTFVTITGDTGSADTTYTDDTVEPDKQYVYRIKAINEHGEVSEESDWVRGFTPAIPVPDKPTGLSPSVSHDTVTLTWDDPQDDAITGYVILRRDREIHPEGTFVTITGDTGSTDTTYIDETVEPDKEYVYRIKAINEYGKVSERSDWVRGFTPAAPQPDSPATGQPTISGTAQVGEELTADTSGIADTDGLTNAVFAYQWLSDDAEIGGATDSTYTLVDDDEGQTIKVRVIVTDDAENDTTLTSEATDAVEAAPQPNSPATGQPTISGTAQVGEMLTADTSGIADADGLTNATYSYQWLGDDTDIAGATSSTYTLVDDDEGQTIKVRVTVADDLGNETTLTSAATEAVDAKRNTAATGRPTISGTVRVGETLTADTTGIGDADGLTNVSYSYQWVVTDGGAYIDISGETGATYTLVSADRGLHILVRVSFTDDAGKRERLASAETEVVAAAA